MPFLDRKEKMTVTEKLIEKVKNCGQTIIDNAESIVGDYKYQTEICVVFTIGAEDEPIEISAEQRWMPEAEVANKKYTSCKGVMQ